MVGIKKVESTIKKILLTKRKAQLLALSNFYAAKALQIFRQRQGIGIGTPGEFWNNQTSQAALRVFSDAFQDRNTVGWFIAHGVDYGVYLELANDRQNEMLRPIVQELAPEYIKDCKRLYGG